jgi:hypothetical protein
MKSIKVCDYFAIVNPKYSVLQLIPSTTNRNYDTELIAATISGIGILPPFKRLSKSKLPKGFSVAYQIPEKTVFIMQIEKADCRFYLIVPERLKTLFVSKCMEVWKRVTVKELEVLPELMRGLKYSLSYKQSDALSLKVNKKSNEPLGNILSVKSVLDEGEEVDILSNFIPMNQRRWAGIYSTAMQQLKLDLPLDKQKLSATYLLQASISGLFLLIDYIFGLIDTLIFDGDGKKEKAFRHDKLSQLSPFTIKKESAEVLETQILVSSYSNDSTRAENNIKTIMESYRVITQDNSLIPRKLKNDIKIEPVKYKQPVAKNIMSTAECNNLIQLPGRELIQTLNVKTKVDVLETDVPEELQSGNIPLGNAPVKDKKIPAFLPMDYNFANLAFVVLGPQGAGKSNFFANYAKAASGAGESNVFIDFVKNCELSEAVKRALNGKKIIDIDLSNPKYFQAFAFNDVSHSGGNEFEKFEVASMKAEQTLAFIDAINTNGIPLTGNMRRILNAAAMAVYLHNNASIGDVIRCLENHRTRADYIKYINENISEEGRAFLDDSIEALADLDKVEVESDKKSKEVIRREVVGTKRNEIEGILDRINLLKENINCKYMFTMKSDKNVDFVKEIEAGNTILIRMPEHKFQSKMVKNVLVTFYTSKIMLATKLRGALHDKPNRCNVFYDEIYQAPTTMGIITENLSQLRKFGTKIIISAHHMGQFTPELKDEIHGSGASYMMLQGCDKKVFDDLKDEMKPFELEDLLNIKQYHSLNLIRTKQGYQKFITALPKALF